MSQDVPQLHVMFPLASFLHAKADLSETFSAEHQVIR